MSYIRAAKKWTFWADARYWKVRKFLASWDGRCNHRVGGGWGSHMSWAVNGWVDPLNQRFYGHKNRKDWPKVGEVVRAEMDRAILFVLIEKIDSAGNPNDMFFASGVCINREEKPLTQRNTQ